MKIVLYFKKLNIGGAERSTVRLLNEFAKQGHDVTLFVQTKGGDLESEIAPSVKIEYIYKDSGQLKDWDRTFQHLNQLSKKNLASSCLSYIYGQIRRMKYRLHPKKYDLAITGWHGYSPVFLKKYTNYDVHFQMIRNENAICINGKPVDNVGIYEDNLNLVDAYICVSNQIKKYMDEYCKIPTNRIHTIYNIIDIPLEYSDNAVRPVEYNQALSDEIIIVTVCRLFDKAKGLFRMVDACKKLKDEGLRFKWFVVGDGTDKEALVAYIKQNSLEQTMILCGFQKNPFPYYKFADIVAVLSYMEGLCGTVNEAKLMERPLIATRFSAIEEQITHGENGYIVDNNLESIVNGMRLLITDGNYRDKLACNGLPNCLIDNTEKVRLFEQVYLSEKKRKDNL